MMELVFLLEEPSMKEVLDTLLPQMLPEGVTFVTIKHEGKSDLEKSIPRKIKAFQKPNVFFIILRDQDSSDCVLLKKHLIELCSDGGRPDSLVRIVCHELESWFLGDLKAVEGAYEIRGISNKQKQAKFRDPDKLGNPSTVLKSLVPSYQKLVGSRMISKHMSLVDNRSTSYNAFINGVEKIITRFIIEENYRSKNDAQA